MLVNITSEEARQMTVQQAFAFHDAGVDVIVEGDYAPPTEESIGQDDGGNEIFVPVDVNGLPFFPWLGEDAI